MYHYRMKRQNCLWMLLPAVLLAAAQIALAAPVSPGQASAARAGQRIVYEGVVSLKGKTIGTTILLEASSNTGTSNADSGTTVTGWIQRHDFFSIESGRMDEDQIVFTSGGNHYTINQSTDRISYSGPDGSGNKRVEEMTYISGRVYRLTEAVRGRREITLQKNQREKHYLVGAPSVWKRAGPPIDNFPRLEEVLGKTVGAWLSRSGGTHYLAVLEEPEGMDLQKKRPQKKKKKK